MRYIAKKDTWFDEGTEVKLIFDYRKVKRHPDDDDWGLFSGIRDGRPDEEVCSLDEFDVEIQ